MLHSYRNVDSWKGVEDDTYSLINRVGQFNITPYSLRSTLIEFACLKDRDELLDAGDIFARDCMLETTRWNPRIGTLDTNCFEVGDHWVFLHGLPMHLWITSTLESVTR